MAVAGRIETLKGGRYVLVDLLGEGTQGRTFDGADKREGRAVAIKQFDVRGARAWKDVELAEREARVLQSLSHPNLPRYVEHFEEEGALYLVMEKIEGESLAALRRRGVTLGEEDVWQFLRDAADVLAYLHGRAPPVIHRDLKPGNVVRRPDGAFAFVDFGAVRDKLRPDGGSTIIGTFGYMAPEQFQGRALPASDVYAIGATALTMLTGREPEQLPHKGLAVDVQAALRGCASEPLVAVIETMLQPDPDERPSSIAPLLGRWFGRGAREAGGGDGGHGARQRGRGGDRRAGLGADEGYGAGRHEGREGEPAGRFERKARAYERRAREYERRAEQGGPAAAGWLRGAQSWWQGAEQWREAGERYRESMEQRADRRQRRKALRQARHMHRDMRRYATFEHGLPFPFSLLFALAFSVGIVAVSFATQLFVPIVLLLLSVVLGRRFGEAASAVRSAGRDAIGSMERSRQWFRGGMATDDENRNQAPSATGAVGEGGVVKPTDPDDGAPRARVRVAPQGARARVVDHPATAMKEDQGAARDASQDAAADVEPEEGRGGSRRRP